jgi:hypothetical protein
MPRPLEPFTLEHFREYASRLVFEDHETHPPEDWQLAIAGDVFKGYTEVWEITPEANGKSTFIAQLALYGADYSHEPWIPVGAAAAQQAKIIYTQAEGFVHRTPGMRNRFKCLGGYKLIRSLRNHGVGIQIYAHDPKTGDGVIPYPFAILDELHRHPDLRLYSLWLGKLRKRGGQLLAASTAGEPYSPFENLRKQVRDRATKRKRDGAYLRAEGGGLVLHEYMVQREEDCSDMERVKEANPFSGVTVAGLTQQYDSPTRDDGDWKRLKCNRPARSAESAITDKEWDDAQVRAEEWDQAQIIDIGLDWAPKWDTTALVPLWKGPHYRLLGPPKILVPPRDGTFLHPDEVKTALHDLGAGRTISAVIMDMSRAQDIAAYIEDELGLTVIEWGTSNKFAVEDFNSVMEGLRNGTLKHTGDPGLRVHAMNAIARRLPGGDYRFERPNQSRGSVAQQDRRVIDALTAMGMVVSFSNRQPAAESVYASRGMAVA